MELFFLCLLRDFFVYAGIILLVVYLSFKLRYDYWKERNFPYLKPKFPLGNNKTILCKFLGPIFESLDYYDELKKRGYKFAGVFNIVRPILVVADPYIVKDMLVTDFTHFANRHFYSSKFDPLSVTLFSMDAVDWKKIRMKISPSFSSGRIKMMIPSIVSVSRPMINKIDDLTTQNADINIKELTTTFTINTLATSALGIETGNSGRKDIFMEMVEKHLHPESSTDIVRFSFIDRFPDICRKLRVNLIRKEVTQFFRNVQIESMKYREESGIWRPDILDVMVNIKNDSKNTAEPVTDDQLAAQMFIFFLASLDTSSSTILFALYELANNPEMQERTRREINVVLKKHDGQINADSLHEMKYLRQVINETLRLYPPLPTLERKCTNNYRINDSDLTIEKGINIIFPIFGIQRDPDNYPEPDKFDPERFNEENKQNIKSGTYLPFGIGPRNCIGLRFGIMITQIALIEILKSFRMSVSSATRLPLEFDKQALMLISKNPILFKAERIPE